MSVLSAITEELDHLSAAVTAPGLAAAACALAGLIDNATGATSAANAARELRMIMVDLRELAPVASADDTVTRLADRRKARRDAG